MSDPLRELLETQIEEQRRGLPWLWILAGVLLVGGAIWIVLKVGGSDGNNGSPVATTAPTSTTASGSPVVEDPGPDLADPIVVLDEPRVLQAQEGPEPDFDTSALGVEQVLIPIEDVGLAVRTSLENQMGIDAADRLAIGAVDGQAQLFAVAGTIADPYLATYGAPGFCHLLFTGTDLVGDCFGYDPPEEPTALFVGSIGIDYLAWAY